MARMVDSFERKGTTASNVGPVRVRFAVCKNNDNFYINGIFAFPFLFFQQWMAPEALGAKEYSSATDSWAWANTVVEIFDEKPPFEGMDLLTVATKVRDTGMSPKVPPQCPEWLAEILKQCWNMDPKKRPTVTQIAHQIDAKLNG